MIPSKITPLIMAGGAGTRLWPVSRDSMPKQFIRLLDDGMSTFQATLLRVKDARFGRPIVVTNHEFRFVAAEQMQALGVAGDIVIEPERRDSAAAVAIGALLAQAQDPNAVAVALAADHVIRDTGRFRADCAAAAAIAATGLIMTLGIAPTAPSSPYGYIEPGEPLGASNAFRLQRFVRSAPRTLSDSSASSRNPTRRPRSAISNAASCGTAETSSSRLPPCSTSWSASRPRS